MKTLRATLAALMLLALLAIPAVAGGDTGSGDDMVTKTFELTVNGTPPADAAFIVGYVEEGQNPEEEGTFAILCGDTDRLPEEERDEILQDVTAIVSDGPCAGGGNVYTYSDEFARGTRIAYFFARASVTDTEFFEIFHTSLEDPEAEPQSPEDYETVDTDMTNSAWYTFSGAADDQHDIPDDMPDTGAGALAAGSGLPWGALAAPLLLLAAGGYAARRR